MLRGLEEAYEARPSEGEPLRKSFDAIEGQLRCLSQPRFRPAAKAACRTSLVLPMLASDVADRGENRRYSALKQ